jgi:hypothetical protein
MGRRRRSRREEERGRETAGDRALEAPAEEGSPAAAVLALQRSAGNAAVSGLIQREDFQLQTPELGASLRQRSQLSLLGGQGLTLDPPPQLRLTPQQLSDPAPPPPGIDFSRGTPGAQPASQGPQQAQLPEGVELEAEGQTITVSINLRDRPLATLPNYFGTLDILTDPTVSLSMDFSPQLAPAAEASATLLTQHFRTNGREIASLALSATAGVDAEGPSGSATARAEVPIAPNAALNFTLKVQPVGNADGGVDLRFSPVVGAVVRF